MAPAMGQPNPEFDSREAELFQRHLDQPSGGEGLLDRVISRAESTANSRRLIEGILNHPSHELFLAPDVLLSWHRGVFRRPYPEIGRFRTEHDPPVGFAAPVFDAAADKLILRPVRVSPPAEIPERLAASFERFHTAAAARPSAEVASELVAELQTAVITIHPFLDGNSRTTNILTQAALHYLGQPEFDWGPKDWKLAAARSYAVRPDEHQSIEPLAQLITARVTARRGG